MGKTIYDAGYGNRSAADFVKLLKDAGITVVLDVRRKGSRSWNGKYNQGVNMEVLLANYDIGYQDESYLANECESLDEYKEWLSISSEGIEWLVLGFDNGAVYETFCLICACGDIFEKDGTTPRCHRYYVSKSLVKELGEGWEVVHL